MKLRWVATVVVLAAVLGSWGGTGFGQKATITVTKTVVGWPPSEDWHFMSTDPMIGNFTLPPGGGTTDPFTVKPGKEYTIIEKPYEGYTVSYRVNGAGPFPGSEVTVTPEAGDEIVIEFINTHADVRCTVAMGGTLAFEDWQTVESPATVSPVSTLIVEFKAWTNAPGGHLFRLNFSPFTHVKWGTRMGTTMTYAMEGEPEVTVGDPPGYVDILVSDQGAYGQLYLTVIRSGYEDPEGTYVASVTFRPLGDCNCSYPYLCEETRTVEFTIGGDCQLFSRGDLDFDDEVRPRVESPSHWGWVETNVLQFKLVTNRLPGVTLTVFGTKFEGAHGTALTCGAKLPTQARSTWQKGGPNDPTFDPLPGWGIDLPGTIREESNVGPGYYYGQVQLRVKRTGYNDPEGTYTATVTIVCSGL